MRCATRERSAVFSAIAVCNSTVRSNCFLWKWTQRISLPQDQIKSKR